MAHRHIPPESAEDCFAKAKSIVTTRGYQDLPVQTLVSKTIGLESALDGLKATDPAGYTARVQELIHIRAPLVEPGRTAFGDNGFTDHFVAILRRAVPAAQPVPA